MPKLKHQFIEASCWDKFHLIFFSTSHVISRLVSGIVMEFHFRKSYILTEHLPSTISVQIDLGDITLNIWLTSLFSKVEC